MKYTQSQVKTKPVQKYQMQQIVMVEQQSTPAKKFPRLMQQIDAIYLLQNFHHILKDGKAKSQQVETIVTKIILPQLFESGMIDQMPPFIEFDDRKTTAFNFFKKDQTIEFEECLKQKMLGMHWSINTDSIFQCVAQNSDIRESVRTPRNELDFLQ
ncbi:Hypothetical_protein [Hexamita inflata]|uniref:Hypothetical_protein n=1 Tax=Hexamita inflata TaxID=28002 RepID=A0AA86PVP5_9EUKA|nr:Hypothetical protein HINF_LOCUS33356 [Hexamita inflata]